MRMFSDLKVFVFLTAVLLFVVGVADVHAQDSTLAVYGDTGGFYAVGDLVEVNFVASIDAAPAAGVSLTITHSGLTDVSVPNGGTVTTHVLGRVVVTGTITSISGVYVSATLVEAGKTARVDFKVEEIAEEVAIDSGIRAATIVVDPPNPKSPLAVGDVFSQSVEIQGATDLASWQMDVAFNPEVLAVVDISEGDFLEQDGEDALFFNEHSPGKIAIRQTRLGAPLSGVSGSGVLVVFTFRFVASSEALLGLHNVRLSDASGDRLSYTVNLTPVVATHASAAVEDVNQDGTVDILDLILVASSIGSADPSLRADVNDDGIIDVLDLIAIVGSPAWGRNVAIVQVREPNAAAPALVFPPNVLQGWISRARLRNDGSLLFRRGIVNLERLLASSVPSETKLLRNYPNPFNPETWIPYQLSEPVDVTVSIYSVNGSLVRRLDLGHQGAGVYRSRSRAAYWDGRNAFGEGVASGLYFYTLTAGDFTVTRKMLIRK